MVNRKVILHYHIFKNAGTSFNKALEQVFGGAFMEFDGDDAGSAIEPGRIGEIIRSNPAKLAFSTHQGMLSPFQIDGIEVFTTILLRHPLSRISSIYHFERVQDANSMGAVKAKQLSFGEYLRWRWEQSPAFFCFQSFFCARTPAGRGYLPVETIFQRARDNLILVNCIGTVEKFPEFISDAQDLVARIDGKAALNTFYANTSVSSMKDHDAVRNWIIQETDQAFFELINPLIKIDEELWGLY